MPVAALERRRHNHYNVIVMFRFIEAPTFTEQIGALMTDDEYAELQRALVAYPTAGDVIPGLGGFAR